MNQYVTPEEQTYALSLSTSSRPLLLLLLLLAIERTMSRLKGRTPCTIVYQKQLEWYTPYCTHDNASALVAATLAATSLRRDVTLHKFHTSHIPYSQTFSRPASCYHCEHSKLSFASIIGPIKAAAVRRASCFPEISASLLTLGCL